MDIEKLLNDLFDLSIVSGGNDNLNQIVSLLNELSSLIDTLKDENFRQWVTDYTNYWKEPHNLVNDIESFRTETSELMVGYRDRALLDFEL